MGKHSVKPGVKVEQVVEKDRVSRGSGEPVEKETSIKESEKKSEPDKR